MTALYQLKVLLAFVCLFVANLCSATFSITQTAVVINNGSNIQYAGSSNPDGLSSFNNSYLGRFNSASTLNLSGAFVRVTLGGASTTCSATLQYRIYRQGDTPGAFNPISLPNLVNVSATIKRWEETSLAINILNGLSAPGVYVLECYWSTVGHASNNSCSSTFTENNAGNFFKGYFEFNNKDAFTDLNTTTNPVWGGETGEFSVTATSDVTSTSATNSNTLRLNTNGSGTRYMSLAETSWNQEQTWFFWIGRRATAYTNNDNVDIWLYGTASNLEAGSIDGYRLSIGDNTGNDEIRLQSVTNNAGTTFLTSAGALTNNITDIGFSVKVTRNASGNWTLYTSTLPTTTGGGMNASAAVLSGTTVNQGSATNNDYTPAGTGYIGFVVEYSGNASARSAFEFDNLYFSSAPLINCPATQSIALDASCDAVLPDYTSLATLSNNCNCAGALSITQSPTAGTILSGTGSLAITLTVSDGNNNSSSCNFTVNKIDSSPPVVSCSGDITVNATSGSCGAIVTYPDPSVTDNCSTSCAPATISGYTFIGTYGGHTYFRSNASYTWTAAQVAATAAGGHMLTIGSAGEHTYFNGLGQHWIGLTDQVSEGSWTWVTGEALSYTNWNAGEPNNSGNEDYVVINWAGTAWNDWSNANTAPFILEFDCINLVSGYYSGSTFPVGSTVVSYSATDGAGNVSVPCSFTVTVLDNLIPTITCPADISANTAVGACSAIVNYPLPIAIDNCSNCASPPSIAGFTLLGTNAGTAYYVSSAAASYTAALSACTAAGGYLTAVGSASENNFIRTAATTAGVGDYMIALSDVSSEGNFVWANGEPVSYTNWNAGEPNNYNGNENYTHVYATGAWNDFDGASIYVMELPCMDVVRTTGPASGAAFPVGTTVITHSATDASGNSVTCSFNITVTDNSGPSIICPGTQVLALGASCTATLPDYRSLVTLSDACTSIPAITTTQSPAPGTLVSGIGTTTVTITATDPLGNWTSCTFNVNRTDNTAPSITCPTTQNISLNALCNATLPDYRPLAVKSDNCTATGAITMIQAPAPGTAISGSGAMTVTLTASDASGNTSNCSFSVNKTEGTPPVITCPATQTLSLAAGCTTALPNYTTLATKSDNCTPTGSIVISQSPAPGTLVSVTGTISVTLTATDASGNTASCAFNVNKVDNTAPTIVCPSTQTLALGSSCTATLPDYRSLATKSDNCSPSTSIAVVQSPAAGTSVSGTGTTLVTLTATDAVGNSSSCSFNVTRTDTSPPAITCPSNITVNAAIGTCTAVVTYNNPVALDNCGACVTAPTIAGFTLIGSSSGTSYYVSTSAASYASAVTACTAAGGYLVCINTATENSLVRTLATAGGVGNYMIGFSDVLTEGSFAWTNGEPVSYTNWNTGEPNNVANEDYTQVYASGLWNDFNTTSIYILERPCVPVVRIAGPASGSSFPAGTTTVTYQSTDAAGNTGSCSFTVTVNENIAPAITCPPSQVLALNASCQATLPDYRSLATKSDNCTPTGSIVISQSPAIGSVVSGTGSTTVILTATDLSGNSSSCSFNVTRTDNTPPVIICPVDQSQALTSSNTLSLDDFRSLAIASDNCTVSSSLIVTQSPAAGTVLTGVGTSVITLTVTDLAGNSSFCSFNVNRIAPQTIVEFGGGVVNYDETVGAFTIPVSITDPSGTMATNAEVVLASGDASRISSFTSQSIIFPAGSSLNQLVYITVPDNALCDGTDTLTFTIQNVSGGNGASAGINSLLTCLIEDDDAIHSILFSDNAEDGNISDWVQHTPGAWSASNSGPSTGVYSIRHTATGASGEAGIAYDLDDRLLDGVTTRWRFNVDHYACEPDMTDHFIIFLASDRSDMISGMNGYGIGLNAIPGPDPDLITLWKFESGIPTTAIITSTIDWNPSMTKTGFDVTRDGLGNWSVQVDMNGDFDNLTPAGTGTDSDFSDLSYFGVYFQFNNATSGKLAIDDITISQEACPCTWFSQLSGNGTDSVWALTPLGTPQAAQSSRYSSFIVQAGHEVNLGNRFITRDLVIEENAIVNLVGEIYVCGDLDVSGDLYSDDQTIVFKGASDQSITTDHDLQFDDLIIDNDGATVSLPAAYETFLREGSVITIPEGILQTNDRITLRSSLSGTASIGEISSDGTTLGKITLQRFIPPMTNYPYGSWVALGCPLKGATVNSWDDDIITTGFVGSDYPAPYPFTNIQYYNETLAGSIGDGYELVISIGDSLRSDAGYMVYMQTPSQVMDVTGEIHQHAFNAPLSYTNTSSSGDGWNLVLNQYPSQIDFRPMVLNGSGVSSYYLYDAESANFKVYNGFINTGTASRYIASSQSFFVKANTTTSFLRYEESFKSNATQNFERNDEENTYFSFSLTSSNLSSDEGLILFNEDAEAAFEWNLDAEKLMSQDPLAAGCAAVSSDSLLLSIDSRPFLQAGQIIPVFVHMPVAGSYAFTINEVHNLPAGSCLFVEDLQTGNMISLVAGESFLVDIATPFSGNRFVIHASPQAMITSTHISCNGAADGSINIMGEGMWEATLTSADAFMAGMDSIIQFEHLPAGEYTLVLDLIEDQCPASAISVNLTEPEASSVEITAVVAHCNEISDGAIEWFVAGPDIYEYTLINSSGDVVSTGESSQPLMLFDMLAPDVYQVQFEGQCLSEGYNTSTKDPMAVSTDIIQDDITIDLAGESQVVAIEQVSTNAETVEWTLDNGYVSSDELFIYDFNSPGDYTVMLVASNSDCTAADFIQVSVAEAVIVQEEKPSAYVSFLQREHQLDFTIYQSAGDDVQISLYDMGGKLALQKSTRSLDGAVLTLDTGSMSSGIYTAIVVVNEQLVFSKKILN